MGLRRTVSRNSAIITLDLKALAAQKPRALRSALSSFINRPGFKRTFAQNVIARILERTNSGIDRNSNSFKAYSKAYRESRDFALYNKGSTVNLRLTGRMQGNFQVTGMDTNTIKIGITDSEEALKAHGHINGSSTLPKRDFFGLPNDEQMEMFDQTIRQFQIEASQNDSALAQSLTLGLFAEISESREQEPQPAPAPARDSEEVLLRLAETGEGI